ncbi:MAG TPA: hypothetical protein VGX51_02515 [Solirubrobacteraceae bacterium]|jgi:hypothetical protein|nr:hypothetical protein [Solirubrobacteraceae bacterium]
MRRRTKAGLWLIVVAGVAFGAWRIASLHDGTAARVEDLMESACGSVAPGAPKTCSECPHVNTKTIRLPVTGTAHADPALRRFADQATEFKEIECGGVSGGIDFYRFSSTTARVRAVASYPDLYERLFCASGAEVLADEFLGSARPFIEYCRLLRFQLYRPSHRPSQRGA